MTSKCARRDLLEEESDLSMLFPGSNASRNHGPAEARQS